MKQWKEPQILFGQWICSQWHWCCIHAVACMMLVGVYYMQLLGTPSLHTDYNSVCLNCVMFLNPAVTPRRFWTPSNALLQRNSGCRYHDRVTAVLRMIQIICHRWSCGGVFPLVDKVNGVWCAPVSNKPPPPNGQSVNTQYSWSFPVSILFDCQAFWPEFVCK